MEAIIFCGIQASGKSTFYASRFSDTHVRLNMDMLRTRHREGILIRACLEAKQPFVVDNTNPTAAERLAYISVARAAGFRVVCFYFAADLEISLSRNEARPEDRRIPKVGVLGTYKRLQIPSASEGFDEMFYVSSTANDFRVATWKEKSSE